MASAIVVAKPPRSRLGGSTHDQAREIWMAGFLKLEEAGKAEQEENAVLAVEFYKEALAVFKQVRDAYPQWSPALITYRISFCADCIKRLEAALSAEADEMSKQELVTLVAQLRQEVARVRKEADLPPAKSVVPEPPSPVVPVAPGPGMTVETFKKLEEERDALKEQITKGKKTYEELALAFADRKEELDKVNKEVTALRPLKDQLKAKVDEGEKLRVDLKKAQADAKEVPRLKKELAEAKESRAAAREVASLKEKLEESEADAAALRQRLEEATDASKRAEKELAKLRSSEEKLHVDTTKLRADREKLTEQLNRVTGSNRDISKLRKAHEKLKESAAYMKEQISARDALINQTQTELVELRPAGDKLAGVKAQVTDLGGKLAALETEKLKWQDALKAKSDLAATAQGKTKQAAVDLQKAQEALRKSEASKTELRAAADKAKTELQAAADRAKTLSADVAAGRKKAADLQKLLDRSDAKRLEKTEKQLYDATKTLKAEQGKSTGLQKQLAKAEANIEDLNSKVVEVGKRRDELERLQKEEEKRRREQERQKLLEERKQKEKGHAREVQIHDLLEAAAGAAKKDDVDACMSSCRKVLELDPDNPKALAQLGQLLVRKGEDVEGERVLTRAFGLDPDDTAVLLSLGYSLTRQEKADMAVSMFSRAVALEPEEGDNHRMMGVACRQLGWADAAESAFKRAFRANPKDAESAYNLAVLLLTLAPPRVEEAKEWYGKYKALGGKPDAALERILGKQD